jgi:hypothetical protein
VPTGLPIEALQHDPIVIEARLRESRGLVDRNQADRGDDEAHCADRRDDAAHDFSSAANCESKHAVAHHGTPRWPQRVSHCTGFAGESVAAASR